MKTRLPAMACTFLLTAGTVAQASPAPPESGRLTLPDFSDLASRATESTEVTVSSWMLHFASHFASRRDPDGAAAKRLLANLKGITIHSYEFDHDNAYSLADVHRLREQLAAPQWHRLVQVRHKGQENVDMYVSTEAEKTTGLALISSEPRELTIINVVGPINPDDLEQLSGHLDLPGFRTTGSTPASDKAAPKEAAAD